MAAFEFLMTSTVHINVFQSYGAYALDLKDFVQYS